MVRKRRPAASKPQGAGVGHWRHRGSLARGTCLARVDFQWRPHTEIANSPGSPAENGGAPTRNLEADSDSEPIAKPDAPVPAKTAADRTFPFPAAAEGQLVVRLSHDERQGQTGNRRQAPGYVAGGDPIKILWGPGTQSRESNRPGYKAFAWSPDRSRERRGRYAQVGGDRRGERETGKRRGPQKRPIQTVAQLTAAYRQAIAFWTPPRRNTAGAGPAENLVAAWDFAGAAEAVAKVQFAEADLALRLAARREEANLGCLEGPPHRKHQGGRCPARRPPSVSAVWAAW